MPSITKSLAHTIKTIEGNGLALFVDDTDSGLKVKDVNGNTRTVSDLIISALRAEFTISKGFTLHLPDTEDIILFKADRHVHITELYAFAEGTNPSISFNIYYAPTKNDIPTKLWQTDKIITSENIFTEFENYQIPDNDLVWFKISELSGSNLKFHATLTFIKD